MIALCMIVKNEASRIAGCLERLKPFMDQIVVLDTGSTDGTDRLAFHLGAEVFSTPFRDFADARNAALSHVREDWVLVLDPDEEIEENHLSTLIQLAAGNGSFAYRIPRYDYIGRCGWALSRPFRLFRKLPGVSYRRPVFEEPIFPDLPFDKIQTLWSVAIHHDGFQKSEQTMLEKRRLYKHLLNRDCKTTKVPSGGNEDMAMLFADAGDVNHALEWAAWDNGRQEATAHCRIRLLLAIGQYQQAVNLAEMALSSAEDGPYQQSRMENLRGLALAKLDCQKQAIQAFQNAIHFDFPVAAYYANLGLAQWRIGQKKEGIQSISKAVQINPRMWTNYQRYKQNRPSYQDKWLHRLDTDTELFAWLSVLNWPSSKM